MSIFAINVKIDQVFEQLAIPTKSFGYNGLHALGIVLPQGDAFPQKGNAARRSSKGCRNADGHPVSMRSMHTSCPARRRAPATELISVTLGGAYAAVPAR
ncbi:hypothetical protein F6X37_16505 [Paraburkholderia sp. 31.1]|uniref:hypothetical protein n=1 Tax=Paraburkholderia sp. 31.1 TaxID=2615205 RepID=UPI0016560681|nr:hypothetical protein [Paraburkholderia sp. 31.1]MBC8723128.1 hypothetical protein [Paraburkholderia sp. 31.1]